MKQTETKSINPLILILIFVTSIYQPISAIGSGSSQFIAAVIHRVVGMAFYPYKFYAVLAVVFQVFLPQVGILYIFPTLFYPSPYPPLVYGIHHIAAVAVYNHVQPLTCQHLQCHNHRHQLHTVVGRLAEALRKLFAGLSPLHHNTIATGAGVAARGSVCINYQLLRHELARFRYLCAQI